jgi:hypothetical protein
MYDQHRSHDRDDRHDAPDLRADAHEDPAVQQRSVSSFCHATGAAPVQRKASGEQAQANDRAVGAFRGEAARGVSGGGGPLPHLDTIQRAFGGHDVSDVQAHVGGGAAEASDAIGAEAYATGNQVAFASSPTLHTAAHEAAHVVQQRAGVALDGGMDRPGDAYERRADEVADRVVAGGNAADLLPAAGAHAAHAGEAVQRRDKKPKPKKGPKLITNEWVLLDSNSPVFHETTEDSDGDPATKEEKRTFEKTGEVLKGKERIFRVDEDYDGKYIRLHVSDADADDEAKWVKRGEVKTKWDTLPTLTGKTVQVVAPAEVEIPLGTQLTVKDHDIDKGRVKVEVNGKDEWIGRSHVVEYDATKELPEIKPGDAASEDAAWTTFATLFNAEFSDIIHAFKGISGPTFDAETARELFTETQRDRLVRFFTTKLIPDRLFTDDDGIAGATAQQRILIAAHMFTYGKHQREDADGVPMDPAKLHARNCGHWVQTVNNYAGVTPNTGDSGTGVKGSFDQAGNIILGAGHLNGGPAGRAVKAADLPKGQTEGNGEIEEDTPHGETKKKEDEAFEEAEKAAGSCGPDDAAGGPTVSSDTCGTGQAPKDKGKDKPPPKRKVVRFPHIPKDQYEHFQPGDWLWLYNANSSDSGGHSVIFNRWADGKPTFHIDRETGGECADALCFGQPRPETGGKPHPYKFGPKFVKHKTNLYDSVFPITARFASTPDSAPATTRDEVLPMSSSTRAKAEKANKGFMAASGKGKRKHPELDPDKLRESIRSATVWFLDELRDRLTPDQIALIAQINAEEDLVTLVALWERLHGLHTNAGVLAKAEARNTKDPKMIHGAGSLAGEDKSKLTGKLASVPFIRQHKTDYEVSDDEDAPAKDPGSKLDDDDHRP